MATEDNAGNVVAKLEALLAAIKAMPDPRRAMAEWKQVHRLLQQAGVPMGRVTAVVGMRDVAGLAQIVEGLRRPATAEAAVDEETCRRAMTAFRKRMALTVLDEQSKLGKGPLSKGADAGVAAIIPPVEWPEAVWQELVRQGKLSYIGHGFYKLVK